MIRIFQLRVLGTAFVFGAVFCFVSLIGMALAKEHSLIGCWRHESQGGHFKNFLQICLKADGKAETSEFRNGSGWGRSARWETSDSSTLTLKFASDQKMVCQFTVEDNSKLAFSKCSTIGYPTDFVRDNTSGDSSDRPSICWGRTYPNNGDFEVAEITKRTPAIVELENKQVNEDEASVEANSIVVVWQRVGQYACIENLTNGPESFFWVDQSALKSIAGAANGDPWAGSYIRVRTFEITNIGDSKYDVHGEIDHTIGDGPGWGSTTSNEIIALAAKPQANAIQVSLRRDITTAGSKAPKGVAGPGFIDKRCKPMLFVKGPVLLIKDTGDCGDGSLFQGYYLRTP
jgi:hypothetical protein